jgi:hypothetical protein
VVAEIAITGNGKFAGARSNLVNYRVTEDSTPLDPSDSSGGVGSLEFSVLEDSDSEGTILLLNDTVELTDGANGRTNGIVDKVDSSNTVATVAASSRLSILIASVTAQPYNGTLGGAITYYLSLAGVTAGFTIDAALSSIPVSFPGWTDEVYQKFKELCPLYAMEMGLVSSNIVFRLARQRTAEMSTVTDIGWSVENGDLAQSIEIWNYNNQYSVDRIAYPTVDGGDQILQVDAGEVLILNVPLNASLNSINTLIPQDTVPVDYVSGNSVYSVIGKDGQKITALNWANGGGRVSVAIGADTMSLDIVVVGASDPDGETAPYRLAIPLGNDQFVSSLKITGTGVFWDKQLVTIPTGVPVSRTAQKVGVTIDNPFVGDLAQTYTVGLAAAQKYAGAVQKLSVTSKLVNRKGDVGGYMYPTFADFDAEMNTTTFAQFDILWGGKTFADFDAYWYSLVADNFENQAFGNVAGARVTFRDAIYRIRSATIQPDSIRHDSERDTLISDFDRIWSGATFAAFDSQWAGKTFEDHAVIPLWRG